jgi:hypothetical protein
VTISELINNLEALRDDFGDHLIIAIDGEEVELTPHISAVYDGEEVSNYMIELK